MNASVQLLIALVISSSARGCGLLRQLTSPSLKAMVPYGVITIPDRADELMFASPEIDDDQFAGLYPHIKNYAPRKLRLHGTSISDLSISLLLQLETVEVLDLTRSNITIAGMKRLNHMVKLRYLFIEDGRYSESDVQELQQVLGDVTIDGTRFIPH